MKKSFLEVPKEIFMKKIALLALLFNALLFMVFPQEQTSQDKKLQDKTSQDENVQEQTSEKKNSEISQKAVVLNLEGNVGSSMLRFITKSIKEFKDTPPDYLIFNMNTFGGRVDSALKIASLIGSLDEIETISYVGSEGGLGVSWSAGAIIAFSTNRIYMAPGTSMGAAQPVSLTASGETLPTGEKTVSAVRSQTISFAEKNGYPVAIAEAMVDKDIELYEVKRGERFSLEQESTLTLWERDGIEYERISLFLESGKLLTLTAQQMLKYGVASGIEPSEETLLKTLNAQKWETKSWDSSESRTEIFNNPILLTILIFIAIVALLIEILTPGLGIGGAVSLVTFGLYFYGSHLNGTLSVLEIILFIAAVIAFLLEVYVIPGFGVAGIVGFILLSLSLVGARLGAPFGDGTGGGIGGSMLPTIISVLIAELGSLLFLALLMFFLPSNKLFAHLVQNNVLKTPSDPVQKVRVGDKGVVISTLKPQGKVRLENNEIYDAVGESGLLGEGVPIVVVDFGNFNRVVVKPSSPSDDKSSE